MKANLMWAAHNLIAHPVSEILFWIGFVIPEARRLGDWFHEITVPQHDEGTGRG